MLPIMILSGLLSGLLCAPITHAKAVNCLSDAECPDGSYCVKNTTRCVKCLSCEEFKRMPGPANKCIITIAECGPCFDGYTLYSLEAEQRYCYKQITPPKEADEGIPAYIWAITFGVLLVLVFLIVVVFIYLFRGNVLKISSRTLLRGSCPSGTNREVNIHASAPDPPPPYNPYSPVPSDSPSAHIPSEEIHSFHYMDTTGEDRDTAGPFIKRAPSSSHRPHPPRESDDNQNAIVYNKPIYERHRSPLPEFKLDDADNFSPIQDENTTESTWTPATNSNNTDGNTSSNETSLVQASHTNGAGAGVDAGSNPAAGEPSSLSALLDAAKDTTLLEPPAKRAKEHDTNNNGNAGAFVTNGIESSTNNTLQAATMVLNIQFNNNYLP